MAISDWMYLQPQAVNWTAPLNAFWGPDQPASPPPLNAGAQALAPALPPDATLRPPISGPGAPGQASPNFGYAPEDVRSAIHSAWSNEGASSNLIAGVFANVSDESGFDPTLRHPDQPHWGGEAHFAHGLYQEGGQEWNNYVSWLQKNHPNANWHDPGLESQFAAWNLKNNYPGTWARMNAAKTPGEAAAIYAKEYLKPAAHFLNARVSKYIRGVPGLDNWMVGADVSRSNR